MKYVWLFMVFVCASCSLKNIQQEAEEAQSAATLTGRVESVSPDKKSYVGALTSTNGQYVLQAVTEVKNGSYRINVPQGQYAIAAYTDMNENGKFDSDVDLSTYWGDESGSPMVLEYAASETVAVPDLEISKISDRHFSTDLNSRYYKHRDNIAKRVSLEDPIFSESAASLGVWQPLSYLESYGGGLMFLQEFDAEKTPVIFVHGIFGTTKSFSNVIEGLDKERYQSWVLQYPSGLRLGMVSDYWVEALNKIADDYGVKKVIVVAHSMGGLVTRDFVRKYTQQENPVELSKVITVNSPLNGMPSAKSGVEYSPIIVPSWFDVASDSEFVQELKEWHWPAEIDYTLVASYLPGKTGDGVVAIENSVTYKLQAEARKFYLAQGEHTQVLAESEMVNFLVNEIESVPQ
ncbi:alpha/beta fold hydrolase [Gilvimarinus chinensis]|uniref:alpha/beta fold hydrolase n=1 Tax=Gilvimarinus chinensis TaxID=396005 RepID=UPI00035F2ECC|nr:alpha/beta fold hydrolase [Gilvimarinus chinensis]